MKVENPVALRFILQDELYLLNTDKPLYENIVMAAPIAGEATPIITAAMPIASQPEPVIAALQPEVKTLPVSFNYLGKNALPAGISALVLNAPKSLGGVTGLFSFSFGEMMESTDNKKAFWEQMKTL